MSAIRGDIRRDEMNSLRLRDPYSHPSHPYNRNDMEQIEEPLQGQHLEGFNPLLIITEAVGVILVALVFIWTKYFREGFAWSSNPDLQFNWHPLLMTIGLVFLYANGMLIYRTQRNLHKRRLKLLHGGFMIFIIFLIIIAQIAVFDSHNLKDPPIPNLYSLHSWIGLTSIILFVCQYIAGFVSFFYPGLKSHLRAEFLPIHTYFGTAGFIGAIASCLIGLNEKAIFTLGKEYSQYAGEGIMINFIGLLMVLFGGLTVYLVSQNRYKRLPRPEDNELLSGRSD